MPFDEARLQLARLQVDVNYHAAFAYWSLKGVMAERWAHGPLFGSFVDLGNQVTLTPPATTNGVSDNTIQAYYGIVAAGFNAEPAHDMQRRREAVNWISDVVDVLKPRRVVRVYVNLFGLYPVANIDRASERLRERFYQADELRNLVPEGEHSAFHSAVEMIVVDEDEHTTVVIGAVGPPHRGVYFATADPQRDQQWWMGVRVAKVMTREETGIDDPSTEVERLIRAGYRDLMRAARRGLTTVV